MAQTAAQTVYIVGMTQAGRPFRPSDWAERLAGVMSQFRPGGGGGGRQIAYSPWCVPTSICGVRSVVVQPALRDFNVMAWDFCLGFARDNELLLYVGDPPTALPGKGQGSRS